MEDHFKDENNNTLCSPTFFGGEDHVKVKHENVRLFRATHEVPGCYALRDLTAVSLELIRSDICACKMVTFDLPRFSVLPRVGVPFQTNEAGRAFFWLECLSIVVVFAEHQSEPFALPTLHDLA